MGAKGILRGTPNSVDSSVLNKNRIREAATWVKREHSVIPRNFAANFMHTPLHSARKSPALIIHWAESSRPERLKR